MFDPNRMPTQEELEKIQALSEQQNDATELKRQQGMADQLVGHALKPRQMGSGAGGALGAVAQGLSGLHAGMRQSKADAMQTEGRAARLGARGGWWDAIYGGQNKPGSTPTAEFDGVKFPARRLDDDLG
jgi:hypothetical protein